ncbi:hypothetical protein WRSd3_03789 [Shigella dysenteriae WRSd3]|nr:Hypothetical protein Asd1617_00380 [Shigella dysenteriae 1617]ESU77308.1 hypothetical protein WRSd3_03789 [Shigella dysenteriae WRSd3]ESU81020.1 hypothetical protein WRSd5_03141 [Shigella dysenteriae WRSd5]
MFLLTRNHSGCSIRLSLNCACCCDYAQLRDTSWCRTVGYLTLQVLCFASKMKGEEKMPSFDIVSEVDLQEARNAVDNASREVESRFDFRNVEASFELNDARKTIKVLSESDFQVNQLLDILRAKLLKRGIEGSSLDVPENIVHSGKTWFVEAKLKQGIESATQKKIVKMIKDSKLKVQAQIQGDEIRVTGKSRDDLQAVMAMVRGGDLGQPFQFKNFRD